MGTQRKLNMSTCLLRGTLIVAVLLGTVVFGWSVRRMVFQRLYVDHLGWFIANGDLEVVSEVVEACPETLHLKATILEAWQGWDGEAIAWLLTEEKETPVMLAAKSGQHGVLKFLLDAGADPNAPDSEHCNYPVQVAALNGDVESVETLLAAGADPDATDIDFDSEGEEAPRRSALGFAAIRGHYNTVLVLLAHGANVNHTTGDGSTPLHLAVLGRSPEAASVIIEAGADLNAKDKVGLTPLDWAYSIEAEKCESLFRFYGGRSALSKEDHCEMRESAEEATDI